MTSPLPWPEPSGGRFDGPVHRFAVRAYFEDTDLSGVVYHANYLRWFERARSDLVALLGVDQREGLEQGLEQGLLLGRREEAVSILERLLSKRFGPLSETARDRIHNASLEQLDHWTDRLLDAPSLTSLFDGH